MKTLEIVVYVDEMPDNCLMCDYKDRATCSATGKVVTNCINQRDDGCPLITWKSKEIASMIVELRIEITNSQEKALNFLSDPPLKHYAVKNLLYWVLERYLDDRERRYYEMVKPAKEQNDLIETPASNGGQQ